MLQKLINHGLATIHKVFLLPVHILRAYGEECDNFLPLIYLFSWSYLTEVLAGVAISQNRATSNNKEYQTEAGKVTIPPPPSLYIGVLQDIGRRCSSKVQGAGFFIRFCFSPHVSQFSLCLIVQVEFKTVVSTSKDLQFSVEVSEIYGL